MECCSGEGEGEGEGEESRSKLLMRAISGVCVPSRCDAAITTGLHAGTTFSLRPYRAVAILIVHGKEITVEVGGIAV